MIVEEAPATVLDEPAAPARRVRRVPDGVVQTGLAAAGSLLAISGFDGSYGGTAYLVAGALGVVIGLGVAWLGVRLRLGVLVVAAVAVLAYLLLGPAVAVRSRAVAAVLPSPDALAALLRAPVLGWAELLTTVPPVGTTGTLLALPFLVGIVTATLATSLALRTRSAWVPGAVMLIALALALACGPAVPVSTVLHGATVGAVVVAWVCVRRAAATEQVALLSGRRRTRVPAAVVMLGICVLVGAAVGERMPFVDLDARWSLRARVEPPFDPNEWVSPLAAYRQYAVPPTDGTALLRVQGLERGTRVRLAVMDTYDGLVWGMNRGTGTASSGYFQRVGTTIDQPASGDVVTATIENVALPRGPWLPTTGNVRAIRFEGDRSLELADALRFNRSTDAAVVRTTLEPGDRWTVEAVPAPEPTSALVGAAPAPIDVPELDNAPEEPKALAADLVGDEKDAYRQMQLMTEALRAGFFSDGLEGQEPVQPGHSAGRIARFVEGEALVGNAEQYAATLAFMARSRGLPSRVVVGFTVPESSLDAAVDVGRDDVRAWVEVAFEGAGWVAFDPTPPRERTEVTRTPKPRPSPIRQTQVPPPAPVVEPEAQVPEAQDSQSDAERQRDRERQDRREREATASGPSVIAVVGATAVGAPVFGLLLFSLVVLGLKARRRRVRRRRGPPHQRIANGWQEWVDRARDAGTPVPGTLTRSEAASLIDDGESVHLARMADASVFGPEHLSDEEVTHFWRSLDRHVRIRRSSLGLRASVKAALNPASLRKGT